MFERPRHNAVLHALHAFDAELLAEARCYFGGGTAIVLLLGEYRESIDIDFLCADRAGYRTLRAATWGKGLPGLLKPAARLDALRDLQADQYGIRTRIEVDRVPIRFEIVREARIELAGAIRPELGVPVLSREDMYAEKLLANADRWHDTAVLNRDIIDLSMMIARWGPIPQVAWTKARDAYGTVADDAYGRAVDRIRDLAWLRTCMDGLGMRRSLIEEVLAAHGGPRIEDAEPE
jgi:hypothetical protein